jgi:hypothetical protein
MAQTQKVQPPKTPEGCLLRLPRPTATHASTQGRHCVAGLVLVHRRLPSILVLGACGRELRLGTATAGACPSRYEAATSGLQGAGSFERCAKLIAQLLDLRPSRAASPQPSSKAAAMGSSSQSAKKTTASSQPAGRRDAGAEPSAKGASAAKSAAAAARPSTKPATRASPSPRVVGRPTSGARAVRQLRSGGSAVADVAFAGEVATSAAVDSAAVDSWRRADLRDAVLVALGYTGARQAPSRRALLVEGAPRGLPRCPHARCSIGSEFLPRLRPGAGHEVLAAGMGILASEAFHFTVKVSDTCLWKRVVARRGH